MALLPTGCSVSLSGEGGYKVMSVVALLLLQLGLEFFLQTLKTSEDELMNKEYRKKYYIVKIICRKTKIVANSLKYSEPFKAFLGVTKTPTSQVVISWCFRN